MIVKTNKTKSVLKQQYPCKQNKMIQFTSNQFQLLFLLCTVNFFFENHVIFNQLVCFVSSPFFHWLIEGNMQHMTRRNVKIRRKKILTLLSIFFIFEILSTAIITSTVILFKCYLAEVSAAKFSLFPHHLFL